MAKKKTKTELQMLEEALASIPPTNAMNRARRRAIIERINQIVEAGL